MPGRDRGQKGISRILHDAGGERHENQHPDTGAGRPAQECHGTVYFRPPTRLPDLFRKRRLRTAGHGRRRRPARRSLRVRGRQSSRRAGRRQQSLFPVRREQVHRLLTLRSRLRRGAGHFCTDDRGPRLRLEGFRQRQRGVYRLGMRILRRMRASLPHRDIDGKIGRRARATRTQGCDDLCLLRRRLFLPGGNERQPGRSHDAVERRPGKPWPLLREGSLRLGLCKPPRPRIEAARAGVDERSLARGRLGRGGSFRCRSFQGNPARAWHQGYRRNHLFALHE